MRFRKDVPSPRQSHWNVKCKEKAGQAMSANVHNFSTLDCHLKWVKPRPIAAMRKSFHSLLDPARVLFESCSLVGRGSSGNWRYNEQTIKANVAARHNGGRWTGIEGDRKSKDERDRNSVRDRDRGSQENTHKQKPIRCNEDSEGQRWQLQLFVSCRCCAPPDDGKDTGWQLGGRSFCAPC